MKLKLLALAVSAFSIANFAHADNQENHFYAGAGLGAIGLFNNWHSDYDASVSGSSIANNATSAQTGNTNINGTLLAGYAWYLPKNTFLGLELFDNITNTSSQLDSTSNTAAPPTVGYGIPADTSLTINNNSSLTLQNVYGIRALPGYQLNPDTVLYGIVGFARAHATSNTYAAVDTTTLTSMKTSNSSNFNGYQLGLGSQFNLSERFAIRTDIIFTMYGTQTLANQSVTSSDNMNTQVETTAKPSTLEGNISLVYMFG